jgi:beta-lactamase regulating signal transducer with metallopeptidase domain
MTMLNDLLPDPLVQRLGWTLLHSTWQVALVALLLALCLPLLRRRSPNARYVASCGAMLLAVLLPAGTFWLLRAPAQGAQASVTAPLRSEPVPPAEPGVATPTGIPAGPPLEASDAPASTRRLQLPPLRVVVSVWLAGVCALSLWNLGGWLLVHRLRRRGTSELPGAIAARFFTLARKMGVTRPVRALQSALLEVPAVVGFLRPVVLVPAAAAAGMTPQQLDAILAHELAHVRRHDYLVNLLQSAAETLLFYHPAVWWISAHVRREREHCCDDAAAAACGSAVLYADALATLASLRPAPGLAVAASGTALLPRVRRLLGRPEGRARRWPAGMALLAALAVAALAAGTARRLRGAVGDPAPAAPSATADFSLRCMDQAGAPVVGAEVYVFHSRRPAKDALPSDPTRHGPFKSGPDGVARVTGGRPGEWGVVQLVHARLPGQKVATAVRATGDPSSNPPPKDPLPLTFLDAKELRGTVTVPAGSRPQNVTIRVIALSNGGSELYTFPGPWPELFDVHPAADGSFVIPNTPDEAYTSLSATAPGLGEVQWIGPNPGPNNQVPKLVMRLGATVEGRVVLPDGLTAGVEVTFVASNNPGFIRPRRAKTGPAGTIRVADLPPGTFTIHVTGLPDPWVIAPRRVELAAGQRLEGIELKAEQGVSVTAIVVDADTGDPIESAYVSASPADSEGWAVADGKKGRDGKLTLRLPAGRWLLQAAADGPYTRTNDNASEKTIEVVAGREQPGHVLKLRRIKLSTAPPPAPPAAAAVEVRCVNEAGKPVAGAEVYVLQLQLATPDAREMTAFTAGPSVTGDDGVARVSGLPEPFERTGWNRQAYARVPGRKVGVGEQRRVAPRTKSAPQPPEPQGPIAITMIDSTELKGQVTVPAEFNPADVKVRLMSVMMEQLSPPARLWYRHEAPDLWPGLFEFPVAADGSFTVRDVPTDCTVYLSATGEGLGEAQHMGVQSGQVHRPSPVKLDLAREGAIEGTLLDPRTGRPVEGALLGASNQSPVAVAIIRSFRTRTDAAGRFFFGGLSQGTYTIRLDPATAPPGTLMAHHEGVRVVAGEVAGPLELKVEPVKWVTGRTVDADSGEPVAGAYLGVTSAPSGTTSDERGEFRVPAPAGKTRLYVSGPPDGYTYSEEERSGIELEVTDAGMAPVQLKLKRLAPTDQAQIRRQQREAVVGGRVVDEAGNPVPGVRLGVETKKAKVGYPPWDLFEPGKATSGADGRFEMRVRAGVDQAVRVDDVRYAHKEWEKAERFMPDPDATVALADIVALPRPVTGTITGIVVDPKGRPVGGAEVAARRESVRTDEAGRFELPIRSGGDPVVNVDVSKPAFVRRQWGDVPAAGEDLRFVLYPGSETRQMGDTALGRPERLVGTPAPALSIEHWVVLPQGQAEPALKRNDGRWTAILFEANCYKQKEFAERVKRLEAICGNANAVPVVIVGTVSHEGAVRAALGGDPRTAAVAMDRLVTESEFYIQDATRIAYGAAHTPYVVLVDDAGVVRDVRPAFEGLEKALGR